MEQYALIFGSKESNGFFEYLNRKVYGYFRGNETSFVC